MKTMVSIDGKRIFRTTDGKASELYMDGEANYAPKSLWKEKVRDINKPTEEETTTKTKANKMSKATKRHMRKSNK
tara:strand:- start:286 stop:510 length:225 start_codon:yes stop_codon:yes gene_type:complete